MTSVTLRNVPIEVREALKAKADQHRRSLNQEAIVLLTEMPGSRSEPYPDIMQRIERFRRSLPVSFIIDEDEFDRRKRKGRE